MLRRGRPLQHASLLIQRNPHGAIRHFRATQQQPFWLVAAGASCAALFLGSRYVVRAQERLRRQREGLPLDDDDDNDDASYSSHSPAARMTQILGVDFGTAHLRLAVAPLHSTNAQQRVVQVLETADGLRAISAAIAVDNGSVSVGGIAKSLLGRKRGNTGLATRLLLERSDDDVAASASADWNQLLASLPCDVSAPATDTNSSYSLTLDGKTYSSEWAAEIQLDALHSMATRTLGSNASDVDDTFPIVLSIPAGASNAFTNTLEHIAHSAGFHVVATVLEPIAALVAAELAAASDAEDSDDTNALRAAQTIAVVDVGGYVTSVSLLKRRSGDSLDVVATRATTAVAGNCVDDALVAHVNATFQAATGIDLSIDHMASFRVRDAVEAAKIELSARSRTDVNLPFITADQTGAKHLVTTLSAVDLARACDKQMTDLTTLCDVVMADAKWTRADVEALVLVGGGVRAAPVREAIERHFSCTAFSARSFRAEEAVVVGAAAFGRQLVLSD